MQELHDVEPVSAKRLTGRNVIAVIGIDRYRHWPWLSNAVRDASGAAALFEQLGFEPITEALFDDRATGKAIQELVTDDLMALGPEDSLVLFYAGHGGTRKHHLGEQEIKTGYLIPVDASDSPNKVASWIELDGWLRAVALLPAKHILVILDACHSGIALSSILKWRDVGSWRDAPLSTLQARRSRRILTSALEDQMALDSGPVPGHSLFTGCLIEGLAHGIRHGARPGGSQVTTGSELGLYVQRRVETYPGSRQTPDFGTFAFDDRGEMVIPLGTERSAASADVRPDGRRERARRVLFDACERWLEHDRSERRLLDLDTAIEVLTEIGGATFTMDAIQFLDQSVARHIEGHREHLATVLGFVRRTEAQEAPSVRFARLLQHPSCHIRMGAVQLVREFDREIAARVLSEHVAIESAPDILRVVVACLRGLGVQSSLETAERLLAGSPDWRTAAWALTAIPDAPTALLVGDGSDFARDMGRLLGAAGFRVVDEPDQLLLLHDRLDPAVLAAFQMIVVVRGENYHRDDSDHNYEALARYVRHGGLLFATPWVAWETDQRPFASILPFHHLGGSHNEGIALRAHSIEAPLAQELFGESFALEASYENLSPRPDAVILLRGGNGVPLYGFRRVEQGACHYLNVCQHHCSRSMESPLRTAAFSRAMGRVSRWLHDQCLAQRGASRGMSSP